MPLFNIRYADDTVIVAEDKHSLEQLLMKVKRLDLISIKRKLRSRLLPIYGVTLEGQQLELVFWFDYLGSLITEDGKYDTEINWRSGMSKRAFESQRNILTNDKLNLETKSRVSKNAMYGRPYSTVAKAGLLIKWYRNR